MSSDRPSARPGFWLELLPDQARRHPAIRATAALAATGALVLLAGFAAGPGLDLRLPAFTALHALLETCFIFVCVSVFAVARLRREGATSRNMTILGAAFGGVALLDFLHMQSFVGMPDLVTPAGPGKAIAFWLAARLMFGAALLVVSLTDWERQVSRREVVGWHAASLGIVAGVSGTILWGHTWLPPLSVPGHGPTAIKIAMEGVIIAMGLGAAYGFCRLQRGAWASEEAGVEPLSLAAACLVSVSAALLFSVYVEIDGMINGLGHIYKLISAGFIYQGLVANNIRESDTRANLAIEAANLGLWTWNIRTDALELNPTALRIWNVTTEAPATMRDADSLVHPGDRRLREAALRAALDPRGEGMYRAEFRIGSTGGEQTVISAIGKTVFRDGEPIRMVGIMRDVTQRRHVEARVRRSEERLTGIVAIAADAIISIDLDFRITMFNHGAETIFGYAAQECMGEPLEMLLPERYRNAHGAHIDQFRRGTSSARRMGERREIFGRRKNGQEFPAEASISKLEIGGETTFTVVLRDNTERRNAERQLAHLNQALEARVQERTAALQAETERRLEAQAALARSQRLEAFGQLAGGVAHDFNNLLTVISGNQELLQMQLENPRHQALLARAQEAVDMGSRLTARLLTFARQRALAPEILDLNEQIAGMVELLQRSIGEDVTLTTKLAPRLWKVRSDPSEVENAILNLSINARDAMPNGGRLVIETADCAVGPGEVGSGMNLPPGDYVRLSVSDTGVGMSPEVLARAFEPFFTTKPVGKGTGLGLSTIYGFVQQSGGTVTIHTQEGRGTTINCYLPRAEAQTGAIEQGAAPAVPMANGEKILVVEDNPGVRAVTVDRVTALGYDVAFAEDAPAAIAILGRPDHGIDLVLSDVVMPGGMSGFDLARWLMEHAPHVKIVLASGYPADEAGAAASLPHAVRMLQKPYPRAELAEALRAALDAQGQALRTSTAST